MVREGLGKGADNTVLPVETAKSEVHEPIQIACTEKRMPVPFTL